jgi:hypothetical protein
VKAGVVTTAAVVDAVGVVVTIELAGMPTVGGVTAVFVAGFVTEVAAGVAVGAAVPPPPQAVKLAAIARARADKANN